jgi:hypothetical protein
MEPDHSLAAPANSLTHEKVREHKIPTLPATGHRGIVRIVGHLAPPRGPGTHAAPPHSAKRTGSRPEGRMEEHEMDAAEDRKQQQKTGPYDLLVGKIVEVQLEDHAYRGIATFAGAAVMGMTTTAVSQGERGWRPLTKVVYLPWGAIGEIEVQS